MKKETKFLTEDEAQVMLRVPDRRILQSKRDYTILLTLLTTGLRKAEICSLMVEDLKTYRNQAVIDEQISPGMMHSLSPHLPVAYTSTPSG